MESDRSGLTGKRGGLPEPGKRLATYRKFSRIHNTSIQEFKTHQSRIGVFFFQNTPTFSKHTYPGLVCFEFLKILAEYCILRLPIELSPLADVVKDLIIEDW